jgi:hypothetical protein
VILLDTLLVGGLKFVLSRLADAVDAELNDDTVYREELLATQMRLELGEIGPEEFAERERALLAAIREVRARRQAASGDPGDVKITGIEASVWDGDDDPGERGGRAR